MGTNIYFEKFGVLGSSVYGMGWYIIYYYEGMVDLGRDFLSTD